MDLVRHIKTFSQKYLHGNKPILLGYSGGTDSSVLFELLLEAHIPFIAAHVDHGWRESSAMEAEVLRKRAAACNVPYHSIRLELSEIKGNLEEISRQKRIDYFKKLAEELDTQAVCLAHHRDDNNETTLIRLLQGYSLHHLTGMSSVSNVHGIKIIRPLLDIPKKVIQSYPLQYLPIEDHTNHDPQFLRARLRALQEGLGKEIEGPLARISKESEELKSFMASHLEDVLARIEPICCGAWLDLSAQPFSRFEYRYLLKEFLRQSGVQFSHHLIESALEALESGKANHTVQGKEASLVVDRKHLFLVLGIPTWEWVEAEGPVQLGWKSFLKGKLTVPKGDGLEAVSCEKHPSDVWNEYHVPAFLRDWAPMLVTKEGKKIELLSGRKDRFLQSDQRKFFRLSPSEYRR